MNIADHSLPPLDFTLSSADQAIAKVIRETLNFLAADRRMASPIVPDGCASSRDDSELKP